MIETDEKVDILTYARDLNLPKHNFVISNIKLLHNIIFCKPYKRVDLINIKIIQIVFQMVYVIY